MKKQPTITLPDNVKFVGSHQTKDGTYKAGYFAAKRGRPYVGNKKVTFKLPPELADKLTRAATQTEFNKSEICTQALEHWLRQIK